MRCSCLRELVAISCNLPISWCLFVASFRTTVLSLSPSIAEGGAARATMMVATLSEAGLEMKDGLQLFKVLLHKIRRVTSKEVNARLIPFSIYCESCLALIPNGLPP